MYVSRENGPPPSSFEDRLAEARRKQGLDTLPTEASAKGGAAGGNALAVGLRVGVEMVSALAVATGIGWFLDQQFHTKPFLLVLFVLLGGAAGIANVWRLIKPPAPRKP